MKIVLGLAAALAFGTLGAIALPTASHAQSGGSGTMETGSNASGSMKGGSMGSEKMSGSKMKSKKMKKKRM